MTEWMPLLQGPLREQALRAVNEIAGVVREQGAGWPGLAGGAAGQAFLFAELERAQPRNVHAGRAEQLLQGAASALTEQPLPPWLYAGFSGVAWALQRLGTLGLATVQDLDEVDEALLELVSRSPWRVSYDLITGLVGLGVYALERLPRPLAARCLEQIVARLDERSTRDAAGLSWWTPGAHLPEHQRAIHPEGYFNLGAAHGVPSVVALLALCARAGVAEARARELALGGVRWLLANLRPDTPGARFTPWLVPGSPLTVPRSAWCYGDPGAVLCLLVAARALSDAPLERTVLELAREAARRPEEACGVNDAGLCHGAAGLGHVYNRLYQATGEPLFSEAATEWFSRALELRRPGEGVAGYLSWTELPGQEAPGWVPDASLLNGAVGIALALWTACHPLPPSWDGMLMASIPA
jgi:hypothetical protein